MGFAWWSRVATWWRAARRRRDARRPALRVEPLGERALLSGLTAAVAAEHVLVQGLLAGLREQGPGDGTAGLVVVLSGPPAGAGPKAPSGPVFEFDYRPGGELLVSPVAAPAGPDAVPGRIGGDTADRTYLVLIPSDELPKSGVVVGRLEQEATRTFFDPFGHALVLEMPRPPFRPDDRNESAARFERVTLEPATLLPKEPSPAPWGEEGPETETVQAQEDEGGRRSVAGLTGPQLPPARTNASQELPEVAAEEAEADGLAEWAVPESAGPTSLPAPAVGPSGARLVPLESNVLSAVPALLAPPAGEADATEWASPAPANTIPLAPASAGQEHPPALPERAEAYPADLPPVMAPPAPASGAPWLRDLLPQTATEKEGSKAPVPVLDALFIIGWWEVSLESRRNQVSAARSLSQARRRF